MKQKYRMLKSARGVHDGHLHPVDFPEGQEYEIGDGLAGQFIELGIVELADQPSEKSAGNAPSNKAKAAAPENKSAK